VSARKRSGGRSAAELRPTTIEPGFVATATGSALISCGGTRVICTASVDESVPRWMQGQGRGWLTADGGTRCAAITGGYVALALACARLVEKGKLARSPLTQTVAAVSCGIVD